MNMADKPDVPRVYAAIARVQADLSKDGITKGRKNKEQNYQFRGIDDIYNAVSGLLAAHGLCILPYVKERQQTERQTASGKLLISVVVCVDFEFVSAEDGSRHTVRTYGEAFDLADKATNKAMSAAYKYALLQAFAIPTEGEDHDADERTIQIGKTGEPKPEPKPEPLASAEAHATVKRLLKETGTDRESFEAWAGTNIDRIPEGWEAGLIRALERKKKTMNEASAGEHA